MGIDQRLVGTRLDHPRLVVQLEQRQLAALPVDDAEVAHDAGQQLRFARVDQVVDLALDETPHLQRHFVEQVARQIEADRGLLQREAFLDAPRNGVHQVGLLRTRTMVVLATQVEQPALVGIRLGRVGEVESAVHRGDQRGSVELQRVERAGLDQGFQTTLVQPGAVHPHTEVEQAGKGAALLARRHDGLDGLLPGSLDRTESVADHLSRHRFEAVDAAIHVGRLERHAHLARVLEQHAQLVGVVHLHRHVGAEKLGREVDLEPGRVVGQERISGGVRLVEAVARELLHQVEHLVGLGLRYAFLRRAVAEDLAMLGHLLGLLLAHRTAQQVGAAERIAAQDLRGLHDLFLVDHDAVGLGQHLGHQRVRVLDFLAAVLARHEGRDQVHRAGPVQRVERDQVLQPGWLGVAQHALHAARFELEHGLGHALGEQLVDLRVVERQVLERELLLALVAAHDQVLGDLQDGQRGQP